MAAGDALLDAQGFRLLKAATAVEALDDGINTACCCGGSTPPGCTCGTCSSSSLTRTIHLLGFNGAGGCHLLGTGTNYFKVLGTIDVSETLNLAGYSATPCAISWSLNNVKIPSGLTVYYFRDSACTIPQLVAGGVTSSPMLITSISATYSCSVLDPATGLFGPGWAGSFWLTDNHFFNVQVNFVLPNPPGACQDSVDIPFTPPSSQASILGSGDVLIGGA